MDKPSLITPWTTDTVQPGHSVDRCQSVYFGYFWQTVSRPIALNIDYGPASPVGTLRGSPWLAQIGHFDSWNTGTLTSDSQTVGHPGWDSLVNSGQFGKVCPNNQVGGRAVPSGRSPAPARHLPAGPPTLATPCRLHGQAGPHRCTAGFE